MHNESEMKIIRESFLSNEDTVNLDIRTDILESWTRSENAGIDPRSTLLPPPIPASSINKALHRKWLYRKEIMQEYFKRLASLMQNTDSALFWVDENLMVLYPYGDTQLLDKLKSINLTSGTKLGENFVGTNAVAIASRTKADTYVIGSEHYIEALQDYACSAVPFFYEAEEADEYIYGFSFVITSISNFNIYQHDLLYFYSNLAKSQVSLAMFNTELSLKDELSSLSLDQQNKGILLINHRGVIIRANSWFLNNFEVTEHDIRGNFLKEMLPELIYTLDSLQTKKSIGLTEIHFQNLREKNKSFFIECQPLKRKSRIIGLSIFLSDKKSVYHMVNKVANFHAHFNFEDLIGSSHIFVATKNMAQNAALGNSNILITGESGTGKELFAQAIHNESNRKNGPFISVNCAAIPKELIGSELFGYVEGAFTGARKGGSPGKFELANKGTLFLDEIAEMPVAMQSVLLRVLEEKEITRLGSNQSSPIDVRIITATNKNLLEAIDSKEFRMDLYYRLNVINIDLPPLRDRKGDIHLLIDHNIKKFTIALDKNITGVMPEAMNLLQNYNWPGNIRELRNVIERAINLSTSSILGVNDLPKDITVACSPVPIQPRDYVGGNQKLVEEFEQKINERTHILELMKKHNGNKARVAKELGITRASLYRRLRSMEQ